jgi:hypothetical protein
MRCWCAIQFRSKRKLHQQVIGDTADVAMDVSDVGDVSDSSTHQLVESNVLALENIFHDGHTNVSERVASWLESASQSSIEFGIDCRDHRERRFIDRLLQRHGFTSKANIDCVWAEPKLPWLERCESSYEELSDIQ